MECRDCCTIARSPHSCRSGRRGCVRRMDRSLSTSRRSPSHAARRLGSGKFAIVLGGRDTHHPRCLRARSALHKTRRARPRSLEATSGPVKRQFFFPIGVLWMAEDDDVFERGSLPLLNDAGIPFERLAVNELATRWPQINFENVEWGIYEPQSGYLLDRKSVV